MPKDDGLEIFESGAILLHLAQQSTRLLAIEPQQRARTISWLFAALNSIEPRFFELATVENFAADQQWASLRRPSLLESIGVRLDGLANARVEQPCLVGDFSVADIAMATVLREAQDTDLVSSRPRLAAYLERCVERPAFGRALAARLATFRSTEARGATRS